MHHYNIIFIIHCHTYLKIATQCTPLFRKEHNSTCHYTYIPVVVHSQSLIPEQDDILQ